MKLSLHAAASVALSFGLLPSSANAQQRLFALHSAGEVSEVLQYDSTSASLVPVAMLPLAPGEIPRGLAFDPSTGDFIALTLSGVTAKLQRLDPATGQVTTICSLTAPLADGLDRRFDGTLVFEEGLDTLVLLDPVTCAVSRIPTASPIGVHTSEGSIAWDSRGLVAALGGDGTSQRLDPLDGSSQPFDAAMFSGTRALEVDVNGRVYFGQHDGALFWSGGQVGQSLPGNGMPIGGLAFTVPADGEGMSISCAGSPNSTGMPATIEALGSAAVAQADLELRCRSLPPQSFGIFVVGPNAGNMPLGSGVLCIAAPQQRYTQAILNADAAGQVRFGIDLSSLPNGNPVLPGSTYVFQYWHRDVPATSNLSPAIEIDFR